MLNNVISGGQVFLHKLRMFKQVALSSIFVSLLMGMLFTGIVKFNDFNRLNKSNKLSAAWGYAKAELSLFFDDSVINISPTSSEPKVIVNTRSKGQRSLYAQDVVKNSYYKNSYNQVMRCIEQMMYFTIISSCFAFIFVLYGWARFGTYLKTDKKDDDSARILTDIEVRSILKSINKMSDFHIGNMPLVKNLETRHFLITGSTGCGKTNLIHNLLPQIEKHNHPALVVDQTGEMIARYYTPERGDIIFNPFDQRGKSWDFWSDCSNPEELERFSKILFSFNRKKSRSNSDPFWEQSSEYVFNACVEYLVNNDNATLSALRKMTIDSNLKDLQTKLQGTTAERYLSDDGKGIASSVMSILATTTKPMSYLSNNSVHGKFSLKEHFINIKNGSNAWLFLSTKPSSRELTLPLISCLTELSLTQLMDIGIDNNRRVWCMFDELASLGNLPALSPLMAEGRKYGACVIAALQSLNQLYDNYGHYAGSSIFGQFGTAFFFRNTEPAIAKLFSDMCGLEILTKQQKNISFGANTFRDGVSYNEQEKRQAIVGLNDLASLAVGQCYALLPEPKVRLSKVQVPQDKAKDKNHGFVQK